MGTAVFIDIENLTCGAGYFANTCNVDFRATFAKINAQESITVAAAYAPILDLYNRRRPLGSIVRDLRQLNVSIRDVPGARIIYGGEEDHDAADFQICLDAMQLALTRPDIDTFLIMSRDGGYYALANKLRELGKTVIVALEPGQSIGSMYKARIDNRICWCVVHESVELPAENTSLPTVQAPIATERELLPDAVKDLSQIETTFSPDMWLEYCSTVTNFFNEQLGELVQVYKHDGLSLVKAIDYLKYLIPNATPQTIGFKNWPPMLRFALPQNYRLVLEPPPSGHRIVHVDYLDGREAEAPLTVADLGDAPYLNEAIGITAPLNKLLYIIEWCGTCDDEFTVNQCYESFQDDLGKGDICYRDISSSLSTLASLGFLIPTAPQEEPSALVTRGVNYAPATSQTNTPPQQDRRYAKAPGYSETDALETVIAEVTNRTEQIHRELGPQTLVALAEMKQRIAYLASLGASTTIARGVSPQQEPIKHTWDALPPLW